MMVWLLVVYGVTLAITGSKLTAGFRAWLYRHDFDRTYGFITCPMCVGFWVGLGSWYVLPELCPVHAPLLYVTLLSNGFVASAACWAAHVILARLGAEKL